MTLGSFDALVRALPNVIAAFAALERIGYKPIVPVGAAELADEATRAAWIRNKGMTVLSFWSEMHRDTPVDVFVTEPFDFEAEYERALVKPLGTAAVRFVSIPTLLRMKELAGRPQDRIDIE